MRVPSFLATMSPTGRVSFGLKSLALCIMVGAAVVGHPPSRAQSILYQLAPTPEDQKQDSNIQHNSDALAEHAAAMNEMNKVLVVQGEDLARLDTKMTFLFGILAVIQGGGLAVTVAGKRRS